MCVEISHYVCWFSVSQELIYVRLIYVRSAWRDVGGGDDDGSMRCVYFYGHEF